MIDEPYPQLAPVPATSTPTPAEQRWANSVASANNNTNCAIVSVGAGLGAVGSYNGTAGHFNIFQGVQNGVNAIAWTGVPIDAPGTAGTRMIRITNIRANAFQLGVSSTLVPTQISMIIGVNGSQTISILQPGGGNVVGQVTPGLLQPPSVGQESRASLRTSNVPTSIRYLFPSRPHGHRLRNQCEQQRRASPIRSSPRLRAIIAALSALLHINLQGRPASRTYRDLPISPNRASSRMLLSRSDEHRQ